MKIWTNAFIIFSMFLTSSMAMAKVEISKLDFKKNNKTGTLTIHYKGQLNDYPELQVNGKAIQVSIPNSKVRKPIEKAVSFSSALKDTQLRVYQSTSKTSKIKALLPFKIENKADKVALTIRENKIELSFPRVKTKLASAPKFGSIMPKKKKPVKKEFLNEAYLDKLIKIDSKEKTAKKAKPTIGKTIPAKAKKAPALLDTKTDKVSTALASPLRDVKKSGNQSISLIEYGGKFVAFLGLVLLLFYGVVTLMKKGFIKKGKLGFLHNADMISVIQQKHIAPKKSLMLIKAHNQVFLVSNTDAGIQPISEIKDAAGLLKEGEKAISGHNFDTNLGSATEDEAIEEKVQLKKDIMQSNQQSSLSNYMEVKEKVSFSDQLKKKVKDLKPLQ